MVRKNERLPQPRKTFYLAFLSYKLIFDEIIYSYLAKHTFYNVCFNICLLQGNNFEMSNYSKLLHLPSILTILYLPIGVGKTAKMQNRVLIIILIFLNKNK